MEYTELNETNLEAILKSLNFDEGEIAKIRHDREYFDRYILVQDGSNIGFLTVLRQPFGDPYLDLTLDECDLLNYKGKVSIESFLDVMDTIFEIPQITRCYRSDKEAFMRRGFEGIKEKEPRHVNASRLIPIKFEIKDLPAIPLPEYIRPMNNDDIPQIITLFSEEYPIRTRAVRRMYEMDPTSCFVYEEGDVIKGAVFGEQLYDSNTLSIHQLLVKRSEQGKHIDRALLNCIVSHALESGVGAIKGMIRGNLLLYYLRTGATIDETAEDGQYLVRFEIHR